MTNTGGCFCGKIKYEFEGDDMPVANCHCTMCRRTSGAPYVTWLVVPVDQFQYTAGAPKELNSSKDGSRYFCDSCGTPVTCINASHPEIVDVTLGSLDEPDRFPPTLEFYEDSRLSFVHTPKKD